MSKSRYKIEVTRSGWIYVYEKSYDMRNEEYWARTAKDHFFTTEDDAKKWIDDQMKWDIVKSYEYPCE